MYIFIDKITLSGVAFTMMLELNDIYICIYIYITTHCVYICKVLQYDGYGPPVDVWGVGCLAFEMMTLDFLHERKGT